ncbi:DUF5801 repeats-in-toxin domain-containing protein, partial [Celeribacter litoreus]|uniref:DUF5801 repeats-in-toxin domain-containing protein n=1 Tax=Celeribacter litoreus TaxID=2876714 RepID=UPI001CC9D7C8
DNDDDTDSDSADVDLGGNFGIGDDAPKADVTDGGTEPDAVYLFDGNTTVEGNYEGADGTGYPTGDATADQDPTSVTVGFAGAFDDDHAFGADGEKAGGGTSTSYSLVLTPVLGSDVMLYDGTTDNVASSGGVDLVWAEVKDGETVIGYAAVTDDDAETEIFSITVNSSTGEVTFDQSGVIDQPLDDNDPVTQDILMLSDGQVAIRRSDTITDNDDDTDSDSADVDLGGNFGIGDDAPLISPDDGGTLDDIPSLDFIAGESETVDEDISYGADGGGTYIITSVSDVNTAADTELGTITSEISDDDLTVIYKSSAIDAIDGDGADQDGRFLQITIDPETGDYTATMLASPPLRPVPLLENATTPGGPVEEYTPPAPADFVTFDGFTYTDWDGDGTSLKDQFDTFGDNEGPEQSAESNEDVNIDSNGIGLENAMMNEGEGLLLDFDPDDPVAGLTIYFAGATGGLQSFNIHLEAYDENGNLVGEPVTVEIIPAKGGKNAVASYTFTAEDDFTELYMSTDLEGNDGIRIPEIVAFTYAEIDDLEGTVNVQLSDFDGDTDTGSFDWSIDGDLDGSITVPTV